MKLCSVHKINIVVCILNINRAFVLDLGLIHQSIVYMQIFHSLKKFTPKCKTF